MGLNADLLRDVFERKDLGGFAALLDPDVSWTWWEPEPACHSREQVLSRIEQVRSEGQWGHPEVIADAGEQVVIDPHPDPPFAFAPEIHHVYAFREGRIVEMRDYPNRASALEAVGLS